MQSAEQQRRRTRIVCISDTHNQTPQLPKGDVLIHAGDLTNQGSYSELSRTVAWLEKADFEVKIVIAGNHDITLDSAFYGEHWACFHNQRRQDAHDCAALLRASPSITYLQHEARHVRLTSPLGPQTQFTVFGSPFSPAHGLWAFGYADDDAAAALWDQVPANTDVLVTHTPPARHCDRTVSKSGRAGCEHLRRRLCQVRPRLHVCGHLHEGRGAEVVRWASAAAGLFEEAGIEPWTDSGAGDANRKQSLLSLVPDRSRTPWVGIQQAAPGHPGHLLRERHAPEGQDTGGMDVHVGQGQTKGSDVPSRPAGQCLKDGAETHPQEHDSQISVGGVTYDQDRTSTCVVNAAIMRNSFGGPKRLNKPIVVDIELPVWSDD